jgi:MoaA/NifB/PqqE/SkfB family radical SAM enzyme
MSTYTLAQQVNRTAAEKNVPLSVFLEITRRCNCNCYYCYQKQSRGQQELTTTHWKRILDELADSGTLYCTLSGGEPFVRDDIFDIISHARKRKCAVSIISNALLIDRDIVSRLHDLGIMDIGISLLAAAPRLHDRLSGRPGHFDTALNAVRMLVGAGIKVVIKHTVSSANFGEYRKIERIAETEGCALECDSLVLPDRPGTQSPFALTAQQEETFLREMNIGTDLLFCDSSSTETLHCDAGRSLCGITPDGDVVPCILLPIVFGNCARRSFTRIWNGAKADAFRREEKTLLPECECCDKKHICSRCHAAAYFETLQWRGKSPSLCRRTAAFSSLHKQ